MSYKPLQEEVDEGVAVTYATLNRDHSINSPTLIVKDPAEAPVAAGKPSLAFLKVSYSIPSGWKGKSKTILRPVSGIMKPGLNAIMGPTGSGKTTLLDILADRKANSRVGGVVLYNSELIQADYRFSIGYVVQDDVVTGSLTVRENLHFSASLRLPSHMSMKERKERVEKVINELCLNSCADRKIGTEFVRGVSGGERKRTNIGMELITEPQVLFLDEPTTGLDAHTAVSVIKILKGLTENKNRIVVMSIHQPRYSIFKLFDTLTLLSLGNLVYHGPAGSSLDYFNSIGYECEEHDNPADFFLDVIDTMEQNESPSAVVTNSNRDVQMRSLITAFESSSVHQQTLRNLQPLLETTDTPTSNSVYKFLPCSSQYASNPWWQFLVVCYRSGLKMWRNPMTNIVQLFVMLVFAGIVGGIYYQRPDTPRGMQDRLGVLFFVVMSQVFSNLGAVELFIKERVSFLHETSSGYYRVSVFFLAKVITDLLILRLGPLIVFSAVTYYMIEAKFSAWNLFKLASYGKLGFSRPDLDGNKLAKGLQPAASKFFIYCLTLALTTLSGASIAFAFSALVSVFAVANLLVSLVFILYMLFGGFLIGLSSLPAWIQWMKYISLFRYAIEALANNELQGKVFTEVLTLVNGTIDRTDCVFGVEFDPQTNQTLCVASGDGLLNFQGYNYAFPWIWYDQVALFAHSFLWLLGSYVILRIVKAYYRQYK